MNAIALTALIIRGIAMGSSGDSGQKVTAYVCRYPQLICGSFCGLTNKVIGQCAVLYKIIDLKWWRIGESNS